jgi:hypothetical protein
LSPEIEDGLLCTNKEEENEILTSTELEEMWEGANKDDWESNSDEDDSDDVIIDERINFNDLLFY